MAAGANEEVQYIFTLKDATHALFLLKHRIPLLFFFAFSRLVTVWDLMKDNLFFPPKLTYTAEGLVFDIF